ncbi:MAG TPA: META domain-containing protein [Gemmatimonadales bacterium]|nr:META domain-containing protein [Gemmatimonadales bacterium]
MRGAALVAAATVLLAAACGGQPGDLAGTNWTLQKLGEETITMPSGGRQAFLRFGADDERYGASAGCNQLGGSWSADAGEIEFGPAVSTLMACDEQIMSRERTLGEMLQAASHYRINGDLLELLANDNVLATFARETTAP